MTYSEMALICLKDVWILLAPEEDYAYAYQLVRDMDAAGITDPREQCREIVAKLHDCLTASGNWPSNKGITR